MDPKKFFVILDLLTDAYLGLEEIGTDSMSQTEITDEQDIIFRMKFITDPDFSESMFCI